jgi:hypothetical protein
LRIRGLLVGTTSAPWRPPLAQRHIAALGAVQSVRDDTQASLVVADYAVEGFDPDRSRWMLRRRCFIK